jgi:lipopolysaccharide transport system ATP-binding protein
MSSKNKNKTPSPLLGGEGRGEGESQITNSNNIAISVQSLSKCYQIYEKPNDRLKQSLYPRLQRLIGKPAKQYHREFWALKNVSFEIEKGETVGIIGCNGSGKSTLLQLICGTLTPTNGAIQVNGRVGALLELGAGFNPEFTGRENVYMNASIFGLTEAEIDAKYKDIVAFADVGDFINLPVRTYSSGMYVRLAFAVIAHVNADILIIDEALAVGDAIFVQKCMRFIRNFQEHGTLLFVSHNSQAVLDICNKALWLNKSELQEIGDAKEICRSYAAFIHGSLNREYEVKKGGENKKFVRYEDTTTNKGVASKTNNLLVKERIDGVLPNKIEVFKFDPKASWWGKGGAEITNVSLEDISGRQLTEIQGGEEIQLIITCRAKELLRHPIIGFVFRNHRGLEIFADNTFLFCQEPPPPVMFPEEEFKATFRLTLPFFGTGDYAIGAAVADGTPEKFIQHHRVDDALFFKVHSSHVVYGVIGLPIKECSIHKNGNHS